LFGVQEVQTKAKTINDKNTFFMIIQIKLLKFKVLIN